MTRPSHRPLAAACLALALAACDDAPTPPRDLDPAPPSTPSSPSAADTTTASPAASAAPDPGAGIPLDAVAGTWTGKYDAQKGRVAMPTDVKDAARAGDDGKQMAGPGSVEITIAADGDVTGKSQGALGPAIVRGKIDGKMLRTSFVPENPLATRAMTGVLVGIVKGDTIVVELRVAGPDALLVRQSNFELKKK